MKRIALLCIAFLFAHSVFAEDVTFEDIPIEKINEILPLQWYVSAVYPRITYPGVWKRVSGSNGVRIVISRYPYSMELHQWKNRWDGPYAVYTPQVIMVLMPFDFEGEHMDTHYIFRNGEIIKPQGSGQHMPTVALPHLDQFTKVEQGYLFYGEYKFKDWESPITDLINALNITPNQGMDPTLKTAD